MLDREVRLGDIIDDFCVKCKRIMNHAVVSTLNGEPAKVRCRTCYNDHDFRHEQAPPPKIDPRKAEKAAQAEAAQTEAAQTEAVQTEAVQTEAVQTVDGAEPSEVKTKAKRKAK